MQNVVRFIFNLTFCKVDTLIAECKVKDKSDNILHLRAFRNTRSGPFKTVKFTLDCASGGSRGYTVDFEIGLREMSLCTGQNFYIDVTKIVMIKLLTGSSGPVFECVIYVGEENRSYRLKLESVIEFRRVLITASKTV